MCRWMLPLMEEEMNSSLAPDDIYDVWSEISPAVCFPDGHQWELPDHVWHHLQGLTSAASRHPYQDRLEQDPQLQDWQRDAKRLDTRHASAPARVTSKETSYEGPISKPEPTPESRAGPRREGPSRSVLKMCLSFFFRLFVFQKPRFDLSWRDCLLFCIVGGLQACFNGFSKRFCCWTNTSHDTSVHSHK